MGYAPPWIDPRSIYVDHPHPASLEEKDLVAQTEISVGRTSGPGGQHRNKVETAVRVVHRETGIETRATERREQRVNRAKALFRLRMKLAVQVRTPTGRNNHRPSELWCSRRQGTKLPVNAKNKDFPTLLAEALDAPLTVLQGGHAINLERPDAVNRLLRQHFRHRNTAAG